MDMPQFPRDKEIKKVKLVSIKSFNAGQTWNLEQEEAKDTIKKEASEGFYDLNFSVDTFI
jgi:hypothetical protein